jgi:hypothetical protein
MPLASDQIVGAVATRITGLPLAGTNVATDRAWPWPDTVEHAWKVACPDEEITPATVHAAATRVQQHRAQIELRGLVRAASGIDAAMGALISEALTALFNPPLVPDALSALPKVILTARRIERFTDNEGESSDGRIVVTLRAEFNTRSNAPDTII